MILTISANVDSMQFKTIRNYEKNVVRNLKDTMTKRNCMCYVLRVICYVLCVVRYIVLYFMCLAWPCRASDYSWPIMNIPDKSRDQNLRVALYKCLIGYTLETLVSSMPYDEEQITKVSRRYLLQFVFSDTIYF